MNNENLKEIDLEGNKYFLKKKVNSLSDEGCIELNKILEHSKIEKINLTSKINI
jgi:hypothetical protein